MSDPYQALIDDLVAEQQYLDAQLADLPDEVWQNDTPCRGWMVRDVISHLAEVDESATNVASGASRSMSGGARSEDGTRSALQDSSRHMTRVQLVDWWRAARDRMEVALRARDGRDRLPWAGTDDERPLVRHRQANGVLVAWARRARRRGNRADPLRSAAARRSSRLHHSKLPPIRRVAWSRTQIRSGLNSSSHAGAGWSRGEDDAPNLNLRICGRLLPRRDPASPLQGHRSQLHARRGRRVPPGRPGLRRSAR